MEMNIGDMVAAMAARNEAFCGNEQVPEKVEAYNKLKEHAAAIGKVHSFELPSDGKMH